MNPLEILQVLNLAIEILSKIDKLSIDDNIKNKIKQEVLDVVDELSSKPQKRATGSQQNIINALHKLERKAVRREIIEETGLEPNVVSSLLNKLYKAKKIDKIKIEQPANRSGRGLKPEYIYVLLTEKEDEDI